MNHSDSLQGLRDLHLPAPVPFWPPAPGWWILAGLIVVLSLFAVWWWRRRQRLAYRRAALSELQQLQQANQQGQSGAPILAELSILLRRVAMMRYGRDQVAALHGRAWLEFLDRTGRTKQFTEQAQSLLDAPYRRDGAIEVTPLLSLAQRWLQVQS